MPAIQEPPVIVFSIPRPVGEGYLTYTGHLEAGTWFISGSGAKVPTRIAHSDLPRVLKECGVCRLSSAKTFVELPAPAPRPESAPFNNPTLDGRSLF